MRIELTRKYCHYLVRFYMDYLRDHPKPLETPAKEHSPVLPPIEVETGTGYSTPDSMPELMEISETEEDEIMSLPSTPSAFGRLVVNYQTIQHLTKLISEPDWEKSPTPPLLPVLH